MVLAGWSKEIARSMGKDGKKSRMRTGDGTSKREEGKRSSDEERTGDTVRRGRLGRREKRRERKER